MSADNWTTCPSCIREHRAKIQAANDKAKKSYGKVTPDEYENLKAEATSIPSYPEETLREDYEIGITEEGKFYVLYKGRCTACKFAFDYSHERPTGASQ